METTDRYLTPAMRRELKSIAYCGEASDPADWHAAGPLWFYARDRVLSAALRRGFIVDEPHGAFALTDAGRAALAEDTRLLREAA